MSGWVEPFVVTLAVRALAHVGLGRSSLDGFLAAITPRRPVRKVAALPREVERGIYRAENVLRRVTRKEATCLYRSLGRFAALRQAGVDVEIVFGLRLVDGEPLGHAWLEQDGEPFLEHLVDEQPPCYTVTLRHPPRAP